MSDDTWKRIGSTTVICLGLSALDHVWRVDTPLGGAGPRKVRAEAFASVSGGMAATAAVAVARLGGRAAFWGRAGRDTAGEAMARALAAEGVDTDRFRLFDDGQSSISGVVVDAAGERQIVNFRGRVPDTADWLPLEDVSRAHAVLADPRWLTGAVALFTAARAAGVPTILDADMAEDTVFETLLPLSDHAIFAEPALTRWAGPDLAVALARAAAHGPEVVAVTRGAAGVDWLEAGTPRQLPAFGVRVVDTTGAGDVFHGAYALAIGAGSATRDALAFASAAAALKCTKPGGREGIPALADCLDLKRTLE